MMESDTMLNVVELAIAVLIFLDAPLLDMLNVLYQKLHFLILIVPWKNVSGASKGIRKSTKI